MKLRIIAGVIAAALLILVLFQASIAVVAGIVLICAGIAYLEFDKMFFARSSPLRQAGIILLLAMTILAMREDLGNGFLAFWASFAVLCLGQVISPEINFEKSARELSTQLIGYLYVLSLFGFILPILSLFNGREYLFLLFLIVFVGDTTAYFVGVRWGKKKLAPHLSPKKTVEGAFASIIGATIVSVVWLQVYPDPYDAVFVWKLVLFAPILNVLAQGGDLFESMLKRSQAIKDSGSFLPGHGGILDRLDGIAFSAPIFYAYVYYVLETGT